MPRMSVDEATRIAQEFLNMQAQDVITKEEALAAIKKVPFYSEYLAA